MDGTATSFMPLGTIPLAKSHILHPDACNPTMDLVILLQENESTSNVALWRMSGSKVWDVDVGGTVLGLAWSIDGTYLSLLLSDRQCSLQHLSVYGGEIVKSLPLSLSEQQGSERWWRMGWVPGGESWPEHNPGSSLALIHSLPRVTPVEPPKPVMYVSTPTGCLSCLVLVELERRSSDNSAYASINPFAPPAKAEVFKQGMNPVLATFPSLLPSKPLVNPDVLVISPPKQPTLRLLTGTFPLTADTSPTTPDIVLSLAQRADALETFLDVILRGLQVCSGAFRDSEKQTMLWREELEECGQQQDMTVAEVHADLFRFLMAGRCGPAVQEWMGNRMANRTVAKWEGTLSTAFSTIQKLIHKSITPAIERIILILEDLCQWSSNTSEVDITLQAASIERALQLARGMALLVETMRLDAETEFAAADEWCKWLRYEMARAAGGSDDSPALPTHDLKLVWSYMRNGFVSSRFRQHFPNLPEAKDGVLPATIPPKTVTANTDLDAVMRATLTRLSSPSQLIPSPTYEQSFTTAIDTPRATPISSPDTVGSPGIREHVSRQQDAEPWSWANALLIHCREIVSTFRPRNPASTPQEETPPMPGVIITRRTIEDQEWIVSLGDTDHLNVVVRGETNRAGRVSIGHIIVQASFFDDEELAVVFQRGNERYLATVATSAINEALSGEINFTSPPTLLQLNRCRSLGTSSQSTEDQSWLMALNGRAGRRIGFVLTRAGAELQVFDMDDDEEEEDEEDVEMEDE